MSKFDSMYLELCNTNQEEKVESLKDELLELAPTSNLYNSVMELYFLKIFC